MLGFDIIIVLYFVQFNYSFADLSYNINKLRNLRTRNVMPPL